MKLISIEALHSVLDLDATEGRLFWRERPSSMFSEGIRYGGGETAAKIWNKANAGREAFVGLDRYGYRQGRLFGRAMTAHRVIFAMHYGFWAPSVDHVDGNRQNNRPENLRSATQSQQNMNSRGYGGASKYCGVSKNGNAWIALCTNPATGKQVYLGWFKSEIDAARAYDSAAAKWHGDFARLNGV